MVLNALAAITELEGPEQLELAKALLKCKAMENLSNRRSTLSLLDSKVSEAIDDNDNPKLHVVNFIQACLKHKSLKQLIEIVQEIEGETVHWQDLDRVVEKICFDPVVIRKDRLNQLREIVESFKLTPAELRDSYRCSAAYGKLGSALPQSDDDILDVILRRLADALPKPGSEALPILAFVGWLEQKLPTEQPKLREWFDDVARDRELDPESVRAKINEGVAPANLAAAYLLIVLDPDQEEGTQIDRQTTKFNVSASLWPSPSEREFRCTLGSYTLEEMPAIVNGLRGQISQMYGISMPNLTIELFLPYDLLDLEAHRWPVPLPRFGQNSAQTYLGFQNPVVVRSRERIGAGGFELEGNWLRRWRQLQDPSAVADTLLQADKPAPVLLVCRQDDNHLEILSEINQHQNVVGLALLIPPCDVPKVNNCEVLLTALLAGLPLILWVRQSPADLVAAKQECHKLLAVDQIIDLPQRLYDQRNINDTLWRDVTLLWDDPNRKPPPPKRHGAPSSSGGI
jgi:hypothetical protein